MSGIRPSQALIEFRASNVRSYRDEVSLSLHATRLSNNEVVRDLQTASAAPERVLPVAGVFGANASGKSTILKAMADMRAVVLGSFRQGTRDTAIHRHPFLLDTECEGSPSEFRVELILNGVWWQYGFEIDNKRVFREFAYHYPRGRQALVFEREGEVLTFGSAFRSIGKAIRPLLRENALLLSIIGAIEDERIAPLFDWWRSNMLIVTSDNRAIRAAFTARLIKVDDSRDRVLELLRAADLGLTDAEVVKPDADVLEKLRTAVRLIRDEETGDDEIVIEDVVQLSHRSKDGTIALDPVFESIGTQVWVGLIGPVLDALGRGGVLLVDELDASLHPLLVRRLVELFQSPRTNPRCAQLIFNAHDIALLEEHQPYELGRDQIWLAEKGDDGASRIFSLADYRARRDESIGRRYMRGRYGAIPRLTPAGFDRAVRSQEIPA